MIKLITKQDWKTSQWSGGETNEIYIYPDDGSYKDRNFTARISVANTKTDSLSEFTVLPGVNRFLSVLEGEMELTFVDKYKKHLHQFDIENFSGDEKASSIGKYVDFNFMLKNAEGKLYFESANGTFIICPTKNITRIFIFVVSGKVETNNIIANNLDLILSDQSRLVIQAHNALFYYGYF